MSAPVSHAQRRHSGGQPAATPGPQAPKAASPALVTDAAVDAGPPGLGGRWRSGAVLHQMGLQPILVEKVLERARLKHGEEPPAVFADEMALARTALASFWRPAPDSPDRRAVRHSCIHRTAGLRQDDRALQMALKIGFDRAGAAAGLAAG